MLYHCSGSLRRLGYSPRIVVVVCVVDKVALGQVSLRVLTFSPASYHSTGAPCQFMYLRDEQQQVH